VYIRRQKMMLRQALQELEVLEKQPALTKKVALEQQPQLTKEVALE
jgi:hypothetical protein